MVAKGRRGRYGSQGEGRVVKGSRGGYGSQGQEGRVW